MSAHYNGGSWIRKEKRLAIYIRDGFMCMCCGRDLRNARPREIALDHLTCKSNEGSNSSSNLMTICGTCNSKRGTKQWTKFYPPGAHARVRRNRRRALNMALAKELVSKDYRFAAAATRG